MTFNRKDFLKIIARLKATGRPIVPLEKCYDKNQVISIRHDVDDDLLASYEMAIIEQQHGIVSTYFILDTAPYWSKSTTRVFIAGIVDCGHFIGWHNNAMTASIKTGIDLSTCIISPLSVLRTFAPVIGTASHGDHLCHEKGFLNYNVFKDMTPDVRFPFVPHQQFDLKDFGLKYEAYHTGHTHYISDSGGEWSGKIRGENTTMDAALSDFEKNGGKLQVLIHPQWWAL